MNYVYVKVAESGIQPLESAPWFIRMLSEVLPKANPDFEGAYMAVRSWYLEVDPRTGRVAREIGLSVSGQPIVLAPFESNYGVWTDSPSPALPDWEQHEGISAEEFERRWDEFVKANESDRDKRHP
jgi:hypothetical protein